MIEISFFTCLLGALEELLELFFQDLVGSLLGLDVVLVGLTI